MNKINRNCTSTNSLLPGKIFFTIFQIAGLFPHQTVEVRFSNFIFSFWIQFIQLWKSCFCEFSIFLSWDNIFMLPGSFSLFSSYPFAFKPVKLNSQCNPLQCNWKSTTRELPCSGIFEMECAWFILLFSNRFYVSQHEVFSSLF